MQLCTSVSSVWTVRQLCAVVIHFHGSGFISWDCEYMTFKSKWYAHFHVYVIWALSDQVFWKVHMLCQSCLINHMFACWLGIHRCTQLPRVIDPCPISNSLLVSPLQISSFLVLSHWKKSAFDRIFHSAFRLKGLLFFSHAWRSVQNNIK